MRDVTKQMFERRKSPRVELKGLTGIPVNSGSARIVDISASGAQVEFTSRLVPGNLYEMKLTFPDKQIRAKVQVTRSMDLDNAGETEEKTQQIRCVAGLEFQDLAPEEIQYLEDYVAGQVRGGR